MISPCPPSITVHAREPGGIGAPSSSWRSRPTATSMTSSPPTPGSASAAASAWSASRAVETMRSSASSSSTPSSSMVVRSCPARSQCSRRCASAYSCAFGDGCPGRRGERRHDVLVLLGEAAGLLGQVQVPEDASADAHRGTEERDRATGGRAGCRGTPGARAASREAQRAGLGDLAERAERDAAPCAGPRRPSPGTPVDTKAVDTPRSSTHGERPVPGSGELGGDLDEPLEHRGQLELAGDRHDGVDQVVVRDRRRSRHASARPRSGLLSVGRALSLPRVTVVRDGRPGSSVCVPRARTRPASSRRTSSAAASGLSRCVTTTTPRGSFSRSVTRASARSGSRCSAGSSTQQERRRRHQGAGDEQAAPLAAGDRAGVRADDGVEPVGEAVEPLRRGRPAPGRRSPPRRSGRRARRAGSPAPWSRRRGRPRCRRRPPRRRRRRSRRSTSCPSSVRVPACRREQSREREQRGRLARCRTVRRSRRSGRAAGRARARVTTGGRARPAAGEVRRDERGPAGGVVGRPAGPVGASSSASTRAAAARDRWTWIAAAGSSDVASNAASGVSTTTASSTGASSPAPTAGTPVSRAASIAGADGELAEPGGDRGGPAPASVAAARRWSDVAQRGQLGVRPAADQERTGVVEQTERGRGHVRAALQRALLGDPRAARAAIAGATTPASSEAHAQREAGRGPERAHGEHGARAERGGDPGRQQAPHHHVADRVDVRADPREQVPAPQPQQRLGPGDREPLVQGGAQLGHAAQGDVVGHQPLEVAQHAAADAERAHGDGRDRQLEHRWHLRGAGDQPGRRPRPARPRSRARASRAGGRARTGADRGRGAGPRGAACPRVMRAPRRPSRTCTTSSATATSDGRCATSSTRPAGVPQRPDGVEDHLLAGCVQVCRGLVEDHQRRAATSSVRVSATRWRWPRLRPAPPRPSGVAQPSGRVASTASRPVSAAAVAREPSSPPTSSRHRARLEHGSLRQPGHLCPERRGIDVGEVDAVDRARRPRRVGPARAATSSAVVLPTPLGPGQSDDRAGPQHEVEAVRRAAARGPDRHVVERAGSPSAGPAPSASRQRGRGSPAPRTPAPPPRPRRPRRGTGPRPGAAAGTPRAPGRGPRSR